MQKKKKNSRFCCITLFSLFLDRKCVAMRASSDMHTCTINTRYRYIPHTPTTGSYNTPLSCFRSHFREQAYLLTRQTAHYSSFNQAHQTMRVYHILYTICIIILIALQHRDDVMPENKRKEDDGACTPRALQSICTESVMCSKMAK